MQILLLFNLFKESTRMTVMIASETGPTQRFLRSERFGNLRIRTQLFGHFCSSFCEWLYCSNGELSH